MQEVTFVTGNQTKFDYVQAHLGFPLKHAKLDLDEIQALDTKKIVEHKVRQAYDILKSPVLVEDGSLEFEAMGKLPGPFIRFFLKEMSLEAMCRLLDGKSRRTVARTTFGYFDGKETAFFEGALHGTVAEHPVLEGGWEWDKFFIPDGYTVTRAELSKEDYEKTLMHQRSLQPLKEFLLARG